MAVVGSMPRDREWGREEPEEMETEETRTRQEQEQEEEKILRILFRKIRSYEEGKCKGKNTQLDNLPEIGEKWDRMWILVLMVFIHEMVCGELKVMGTKRMKFVLYVAAGLGIREETENLADPQKESDED